MPGGAVRLGLQIEPEWGPLPLLRLQKHQPVPEGVLYIDSDHEAWGVPKNPWTTPFTAGVDGTAEESVV